jgi:hypothetical protein
MAKLHFPGCSGMNKAIELIGLGSLPCYLGRIPAGPFTAKTVVEQISLLANDDYVYVAFNSQSKEGFVFLTARSLAEIAELVEQVDLAALCGDPGPVRSGLPRLVREDLDWWRQPAGYEQWLQHLASRRRRAID